MRYALLFGILLLAGCNTVGAAGFVNGFNAGLGGYPVQQPQYVPSTVYNLPYPGTQIYQQRAPCSINNPRACQ